MTFKVLIAIMPRIPHGYWSICQRSNSSSCTALTSCDQYAPCPLMQIRGWQIPSSTHSSTNAPETSFSLSVSLRWLHIPHLQGEANNNAGV